MRGASYRPDIDGLRAIAVLSVIGFHLSGAISGGFVGVDIFFVISGFLIGSHVFDEIEHRQFSFRSFYVRRIRRLLPALAVTLFGTCVTAWALMGKTEVAPVGRSALASLFSLANLYFYDTSGYFTAAATDVPLLHLWSLGIEEQFYLVFPLIAVVLARFAPQAVTSIFAAAAVLSLLGSQWMLRVSPDAAFYLPQYRAYELLVGVLLATISFKPTPKLALIAAGAGIAAMAGAIIGFNSGTLFPGLAALLPCVGTALVIWAGGQPTVVSSGLSVPYMAWLGRISYPMYLVHWPLIVFGRIVMPAGTWKFAAFILLVSVILAAVIHDLVEGNLRYSAPRRFWRFAAVALVSGVILPIGLIAAYGAKPLETSLSSLYLEGSCFLRPDQGTDSFVSDCFPFRSPEVILLGDSHAADLYHGLKPELERTGYSLGMFTASACPPIVGYQVKESPHCEEVNRYALNIIKRRRPAMVILSAFWKPSNLSMLDGQLRSLTDIPGVSVVVIGNTPVFNESVPIYLDRHTSNPIGVSDRSKAETALREMLVDKTVPHVRYMSLRDFACPKDCSLTDAGGRPYYFDEGHLTAVGSDWIAGYITPQITSH